MAILRIVELARQRIDHRLQLLAEGTALHRDEKKPVGRHVVPWVCQQCHVAIDAMVRFDYLLHHELGVDCQSMVAVELNSILLLQSWDFDILRLIFLQRNCTRP